MTTHLQDVVRRAFDDIIEAAGDLGPCPTVDDHSVERRSSRVRPLGRRSRTAWRGASTAGAHRWATVAAGLLLVVGVGAVAWIAQHRDAATTSATMVDLGSLDDFALGSITSIDDPPLFVVNDPAAGITVFDAHSTHLGCILVVNTDAPARVPDPDVAFVDPCHGSLFDRAGNKLAGPAPRSLDRYPVTIQVQRVLVDPSLRIPGDRATTPHYSADDLDLTLPIVGRGWADSMDFALSRGTNARLYAAWQTAIADCMNTNGFDDYQPTPYPANGGFEDLVNPLDRRYAAVMGYHELPAEPADPNTYTDDSRVRAGECANAAYDDTWGRISAYTTVNDQLRSGLSAAVAGFTDSEVGREVASQWAACMAERGHRYESPSDAIDDFVERPTVGADEIATRLDDLDCDVAVGYTQTRHDWERARVDAWRQDQSDTIDTALEQKQLVDRQLAEIETVRAFPVIDD